ncbi:MAG TPA: molybdate ABC transporter substrate-binding protein [Gemmatimonadales bacterium]
MRSFRRTWLPRAAGAAVLLLGGAEPLRGQSGVLTVFAAASLTEAFGDIAQRFEQENPGTHLRVNYAGSQQLVLQIQQGAQADVFASADERWMKAVTDSGLAAGAPAVFAHNRLVVIVPAANPGRIDRLQDLSRRGLKIVLAAGAVPVGRYSRQALEQLSAAPGFTADYSAHVLANVVSQEENVKAVATKVQLGEADAGIVYRSDVTPSVARVTRMLAIPDEYNVVATYPIVVLRQSANQEAARRFVAYVLSAGGQRALAARGFIPSDTTGAAAGKR